MELSSSTVVLRAVSAQLDDLLRLVIIREFDRGTRYRSHPLNHSAILQVPVSVNGGEKMGHWGGVKLYHPVGKASEKVRAKLAGTNVRTTC